MQELVARLKEFALDQGPEILIAIAILIIGWVVALLGALVVRKAFKRTKVDSKVASWIVGEERGQSIEIERWIGRCVFFLIMLFVLVAFFEVLGLTVVTVPLSRFLIQIIDYAPRLIAPVVLLLLAWVAATGLRFLVRKLLSATKVDEKLGSQVGLDEDRTIPLSRALGDAVYWLIFLLFLPAVLGALNLSGLLLPVQGMLDKVLGFLPNLAAAGLILGVGWLLARIVRRIASNLLVAIGADRLSEQVGLEKALGEQKLSGLLGLVLYILILMPVLVASLNALSLDAVTRPASQMLSTFLTALPLVFAAALVILVAYLVGRVVAGLVANLLAGVGFNRVLVRLGVGAEPEEGRQTPSEIAGGLVMVAIMLFATIEAVDVLGFAVLSGLLAQLLVFAGHVLVGLVIFAVGLYLANLAARTVEASTASQAPVLAVAARVSILILAGAMALRQMGLANEIITLAFGLMLGSVAVAVAIAFGIGGRDIAAQVMGSWQERIGGGAGEGPDGQKGDEG
jgi:hypothetical protein